MRRHSIIVPCCTLLLLLIATLPVHSQSVIMNGNYFLTHNEDGTAIIPTATDDFNPATCLWAFVQDDYIRTADSNGNAINNNNNNNYLQYTSLSLGTDWGNWYRARNGEYIYHRTGGTGNRRYHYPRLNNTTWGWAYNQTSQGSTTYLYRCGVTPNNAVDNTTDPTISISSVSDNTISLTQSGMGGTYTPAYTTYNFKNADHHWYDGEDHGTTKPSAVNANTLSPTYTWSITSGGNRATIDSSTGELTLANNLTNGTIVVNLAITGISPLADKNVTYTLTVATVPQFDETVISDISITPATSTIDLGESCTFTASPSISYIHRRCPEYKTITDGTSTVYLLNGELTNQEPTAQVISSQDLSYKSFNWELFGNEGGFVSMNTYYSQVTNTTTVTRSNQITDTNQTITLKVTAIYGEWDGPQFTAQSTITIPFSYVDISGVSCDGFTLEYGQSRKLEPNTWVNTGGIPYIEFTYSSANENIATVSADGTVTATGTGNVQITVQSVRRDGTTVGAPKATPYIYVTKANLEAPSISISQAGKVTITDNNPPSAGATIYYTTDSSDPQYSNTRQLWTNADVTVTNLTFVKAFAMGDANHNNSATTTQQFLSSGIDPAANTLYINDLEDHTWTYYSSKPDNDYPDALHSADPRNVKITYYANGYRHDGNNFTSVTGVQLSYNETANTFVYYTTIEKNPGGQILTGTYPYKVIPNPFSKRPKNGNTYYGFEGWRIKSGGDKIANHNNNDILTLEEVINFINLDNGYAPNVISAEIELEAIWAPATVVTNSMNGLTAAYSYERNFIVCNANMEIRNLAQNATVSSRYPDGTAYGNNNTTITGVNNSNVDIKVEHIKVSGTFNGANNKWLIVGRGCEGTITQTLCNQANAKFRLESGTYAFVHPHPSTTGIMVFGSDYDRATLDNSRLRIVDYVTVNSNGGRSDGNKDEYMDITIKSGYYGYKSDFDPTDTYGNYGLGVGGNTDGITTYTPIGSSTTYNYSNGPSNKLMSFYCGGTHGGGTGGIIRVLIEGGELSSLNGGGTKNAAADNGVIMHHIRMKGGWVKGAIYGTASASNSTGSARLVITGGEVNGWVAGACNGTRSDGSYNGELNGNCFIYVGGDAELRSHNNDGVYNNAWGLVFNVEGGTVFGAGKGIDNSQNHVGSANNTYISVSDNAYIEQAVYGGAFHGISKESHIYLTGNARVGNVYGGSFEPVHPDNEATWRCNNTDIRMYGGNVLQGIYGGHNAKGTVYGATSLHIDGGQVGTSNSVANIHGGGYGQNTKVSGNVELTLGTTSQNTPGVTVYGDVYGGSALGTVNTNAQNQTNVTLNAGTVNGSLYGGGLGDQSTAADVNGAVAVTVNGGSVTGGVFGGNNINGMPKSTIAVTIVGSDTEPAPGEYAINAVYGGGNMAPYTGNPAVRIQGGNIENVYGGGLGTTAVITGNTGITMTGGKAASLFGGGSQANVTGSVTINMQGGQVVDDIYGGGALANTNTTSGTTTVNLTGGQVYNVFGGGLGDEDHYAQVGGNVQVLLNQGVADNAKGCIVDNAIFGCNNVNGTPLGTVTVHIYATQNKNFESILLKPAKNQDKTLNGTHDIKAVYGGGNMAAYRPTQANTPTHVIIDGCGKSCIEYVYGGGNAAPVPATQVDINGSYQIANVFGGGNGKDALPNGDPNPGADVGIYEVDQATWNSAGNLQYTDPGNEKGDKKYILYGNPDAVGSVIGTTQVYILGGVVSQVFGGSNTKGDIVKEAKVILGDEDLAYCEFSIGGVYGGSNEAYMSGSAAIDMHCIEGMDEIYGGSKKADISKDVVLTINGGRYGKVFGGNNISGRINGSITINIEQTGCLPIEIGELYGGGNQAPYSIYGYDGTEVGDDGIERPVPRRTQQQGVTPHHDPVINIVSCKSIETVYGGGFKALMVGSPEININMVRGWVNGRYQPTGAQDPNRQYQNAGNLDILGTIGTVYGGGNQAELVGSTHVNIGTESNVQVHDVTKAVYDVIKNGRTDITNPNYTGGADQTKDLTVTVEGANITNNIYGGGNNAAVTGQTFINVGPAQ